jgi:hypothetical protein
MAGVMAVAAIAATAGLRRGIHAAADGHGEPAAAGAAGAQPEGSQVPRAGS